MPTEVVGDTHIDCASDLGYHGWEGVDDDDVDLQPNLAPSLQRLDPRPDSCPQHHTKHTVAFQTALQ